MRVTASDQINTYYQALLDRAQEFVGIFYVGVKTTSVFCIATCRARKPKLSNVEFYTTLKEALNNGYRPCKICRPTESSRDTPPQVEEAINLVRTNAKSKITDVYLKNHGISPVLVRRWFNKNYGITYQAFQRMYRINDAFQELKSGKKTTQAAFDSGYDSLSGFGYTFKKLVGKSPDKSKWQNLILINRFTTPLGSMYVCATDGGICLLEFVDRKRLENELEDLQKLLMANIIVGENAHIKQLKKEIEEYFSGARCHFEVELNTPGTEFQQRVWNNLKTIPYGETSTYQEQALAINHEKAVRAMASANGNNRIAIVVPCHRVIGKNGALTGYGGGLERKKWLINHEKTHAENR